jgi:hypothetical protein
MVMLLTQFHLPGKGDTAMRQGVSNGISRTLSRPSEMLLVAGLTFGAVLQEAHAARPTPFKVANIHFETNASACDMGIQIKFDTDGITSGSVLAPNGQEIYHFQSEGTMAAKGGQTEGFLEGIEPQIVELLADPALGCAPSTEEGTSTLADLFAAWPEGDYQFKGTGNGGDFAGTATLSHVIPAGPHIRAPANGIAVPDADLTIEWEVVTAPILPQLGPQVLDIVGYHVIVEEDVRGVEVTPEVDIDVGASETSVTIPAQYLNPSTVYKFEILATDASGNQTISEGFFCTTGVAKCVLAKK